MTATLTQTTTSTGRRSPRVRLQILNPPPPQQPLSAQPQTQETAKATIQSLTIFSVEPKQMVVPKTVTARVAPPSRTAATRGAPLTTTARKRITPHHSSRSQLPKPQPRSSQRKRRHPRRQRQSRPKSQSTSIQNQNLTVFSHRPPTTVATTSLLPPKRNRPRSRPQPRSRRRRRPARSRLASPSQNRSRCQNRWPKQRTSSTATAKTTMLWMLHLHPRKRKKHQRSCTRRTTGPMTILGSAPKRRLLPRPRPLLRPKKPRPKRLREAPTAQPTRWISLAWRIVPRRLIGRAEREKPSTTTSVSATVNRIPEKQQQLSNNKRLPEKTLK